ncbi:hypothetical protein [Pedobacter sp. SYP-B3415]|uniref:hypothetical protein n=1 Tax=Pedobacter sp. SYP-B3415 TaxID=2496641 RepID=UPI00101C67DC|nr:hypothetical protein [Pedobacter sp. SYP-B3415]
MNRFYIILMAAVLCGTAACKRIDPEPQNILRMHAWRLKSATVEPAISVNGRETTNLFEADPSGCLANNFTLMFGSDSTYHVSSNGPLCDMVNGPSKWQQRDNLLTLSASVYTIRAIDNSKMILERDEQIQALNRKTTYIYQAEDK